MRPQRLSEKSINVLRLVADGHSYAQIVDADSEITYPDIFAAAEEALALLETPSEYDDRIARVKRSHLRAYERWTDEEDEELSGMYRYGNTIAGMAEHLGRQPSAISSRLKKLGLGPETRR